MSTYLKYFKSFFSIFEISISYRFLYWCNLILGWSIDQIGDLIRYLHLLRGPGVPWIQCMESKEVPQQPWRASPQQIQVLKATPPTQMLEGPRMTRADYCCVAHSRMGLIHIFNLSFFSKKRSQNIIFSLNYYYYITLSFFTFNPLWAQKPKKYYLECCCTISKTYISHPKRIYIWLHFKKKVL